MSDFDIEKYEFSDCNIVDINSYVNGATIAVTLSWIADGYLELKKQDAIALAKHFKLTQEDLDYEDNRR